MDAAPVIARGHNVAAFVPPITEAALPYVQAATRRPILILTPDADRATQLADAIPDALAVSGLSRAQRRLAENPPAVLVAGVLEVVALINRSALAPASFACIVIAWPEGLEEDGEAALETVIAECDKDAQRLILTARTGPATDKFVERYAFKAMTYGFPPVEGAVSAPTVGLARYVLGRPGQLASIRRRILDALPDQDEATLVIAGPPTSREEAAALGTRAGAEGPVIVAEPHQLGWLRSLYSPLTSIKVAGSWDLAEQRAEKLRARLVQAIEADDLDPELMAIGPLLDQHDPALIAAAALRLAAEQPEVPTGGNAPPPVPGKASGTAKVWIGIGKKDNVKPGDLVGAIVNEAKVPAEAVGKIEVRELFCLVEVRNDFAEQVVKGLTGSTVRGRRLIARVDRGATRKPTGPR